MNTGRTILSQILEFISKYEFDKCVDKYDGNYRVRTFTCWEQFIVMVFAQLTGRGKPEGHRVMPWGSIGKTLA